MDNNDKLEEYYLEEERREHLEHRDVLLAIGVILKTKEGENLFKYLFKSLEVAQPPVTGLKGEELHDFLGFTRAGNSIYKLACEADPQIAANILSKLEREDYERKKREYAIRHNINTN